MAGENEPAKLLLPYLQRADELQKHEPLVAYYCMYISLSLSLSLYFLSKTLNHSEYDAV